QDLQRVLQLASAMFCRKWVDNYSSSDRLCRGITAQYETIAMNRDHWRFQPYLRPATASGCNLLSTLQHSYSPQNLRRADVKTHSRTRPQRACSTRQYVDPCINDLRRP